jgi:hypothetical protein
MFGILLAAVIAFALVAAFIAFYIRRVADLAITDQFRAAESIANGEFPEKWYAQINRRLGRIRVFLPFIPETKGMEQALQNIDRLTRFFENSPFFENAQARELLLSQLREARQRWVAMTWEDISKEYRGETKSTDEETIV